MFVIGITGGIGCGKSSVAQICREAGLPVIDADELSRQVTAAGGVAMPEIIEKFGAGLVDGQGALDRQAMAKKVFHDHRALDQLSAIVHRYVLEQMGLQVQKLAEKKTRAVVLDVPIPVKHGFLDICDQVWVVWASDAVRIARLAGRGMDEKEAKRRMAMQMTKDEYTALASHVIDNDGSYEELTSQIQELLQSELGQRGIRIKPASGN
jgi:dephospho-CoA kinase